MLSVRHHEDDRIHFARVTCNVVVVLHVLGDFISPRTSSPTYVARTGRG